MQDTAQSLVELQQNFAERLVSNVDTANDLLLSIAVSNTHNKLDNVLAQWIMFSC